MLAEEVYFLGIGGIGMSALARYFRSRGASVSGYDKTPTALTQQLQEEGISVHFEENISNIPENPGLIIYTPAIPSGHVEFQWFKINGKAMWKRAEVLGMISKAYLTIAIAGTHGKTTTTTMVAHMLQTANLPYLAFLGGIPKNYGSNYLNNAGSSKPSETYCVVEADEYDRSFLQLEPTLAVITSADADHLDIYGHHGELLNSFRDFTSRIKKGGSLFLKKGAAVSPENKNGYSISGYSVQNGGDYSAQGIELTDGVLHFDFIYPGGEIKGMTMQVPGLFNLENAIAALAIGTSINIPEKELRRAFATYQGVKRRFEYIIREQNCVYIDDYAHHPEELRACITTAKQLYPEKRITGIFQPHLYTRTRDLAAEFAESLGLLDEVILLDIYPARELPIEGVTSRLLLDKIMLDSKQIVSKADLLPAIQKMRPQVLLTMGAGDIDQFTDQIAQILKNSRS
jgi:UDP-N-acetylmuramate--alanine ligase